MTSSSRAIDLMRLRRWNLSVGALHAVQAATILIIATAVSLPVTATYLTGPPGAGDYGGPASLLDLRIDLAVAIFLLLAAVDHLSVATWARGWYDRQVARGINPASSWGVLAQRLPDRDARRRPRGDGAGRVLRRECSE